ncbi:MAG: flippase-like domain-containing protein [Saprospiraceae bacterium]|nr:flippase-like domain-containing protein [Saprospiraceae bacterium]
MSKKKIDVKKILNRLMLFISFGIVCHITFVLYTTEKDILSQLGHIQWPYFFLILILMVLPWMGYAFRVMMWSKFLGENLPFKDSLKIVITADVASALSPTAVGGAPFKAGLLINRGFSTGKVGFILTLGVLEDIVFYTSGFVFATVYSVGLLNKLVSTGKNFIFDFQSFFIWILIAVILYITLRKTGVYPQSWRLINMLPFKYKFTYLKLIVKAKHSYGELKECFLYVLNAGKLRMLLSITVLFMQWFAKFSILLVILTALHIDFDTLQIYARQWMIWITMLLIPTPGASGGAEASFLLIFGKSIPSEIVNLIVSLWRFFTYYMILLTAVVVYQSLTYFSTKSTVIAIETDEIFKDNTSSKVK